VQTFVWRLVATEEIEQMKLSGEWCYWVKRWSPFDQRKRRTIRWCVREMGCEDVRECRRHVVY
jgi:hypothetical protein